MQHQDLIYRKQYMQQQNPKDQNTIMCECANIKCENVLMSKCVSGYWNA